MHARVRSRAKVWLRKKPMDLCACESEDHEQPMDLCVCESEGREHGVGAVVNTIIMSGVLY